MIVGNQNLLVKINQARDFLFEAYFPSFCVNCKSENNLHFTFLCNDCYEKIEFVKTLTCQRCGRITKIGQFCSECRQDSLLSGVVYTLIYTGPVKELVHWFKYGRMLNIGSFLTEILLETLANRLPPGELVVVPVPLYFWRRAQRGFNQSEFIGRRVSKKFSIPYVEGLKRVRKTESQMKLGRKKRLTNLKNAFKARNLVYISGKTVLLIDDVLTTGSTLKECARVLLAAGAHHVWGVVLTKG